MKTKSLDELVIEKLDDASVKPEGVVFTPEEAERLGVFLDDALDEIDVIESFLDVPEVKVL